MKRVVFRTYGEPDPDEFHHPPDQNYLRKVLKYSPDTGEFRWRHATPGHRENAIAGYPERRGVRIYIEGKSYVAHQLAWCWYYGQWLERPPRHKNNHRWDNRIKNLKRCNR